MKTTLFLLLTLFATAAFGQTAGAPTMQALQFASHADRAIPHDTANEQNLWGSASGVHIAEGELPLWEVAPKIKETPLGDVARAQKKEHETAKKARVVWEN